MRKFFFGLSMLLSLVATVSFAITLFFMVEINGLESMEGASAAAGAFAFVIYFGLFAVINMAASALSMITSFISVGSPSPGVKRLSGFNIFFMIIQLAITATSFLTLGVA